VLVFKFGWLGAVAAIVAPPGKTKTIKTKNNASFNLLENFSAFRLMFFFMLERAPLAWFKTSYIGAKPRIFSTNV
jgi:hypothetical protein